jgi:cobalt/nickel transport system ATP-binding protein
MNQPHHATAFELTNVSFRYQRIPALTDISLQVRRGERIALLGANGSGKSTLLRLLGALAFPDSGKLRCFGKDVTSESMEQAESFYEFRRRVGIVFQNPDVQLFNASVFDEVAFGPLQLGLPKDEVRERVTTTLRTMGIEALAERPPFRLSGGEKKRIALASILVTDPEILLLDEPTASLDPSSQNAIVDLLGSWATTPRTVITATHDLDSLEIIADRCIILSNGVIAADSTPYEIIHNARLLEHTGLLRPHQHHHTAAHTHSHPHTHVHLDDLKD